MNLERYPVTATDQFRSFEFLSDGPKGTVKKVVSYHGLREGLYNLAFGDWDEIGQAINDLARSNNNDRDKIIATVAFTVTEFLSYYPGVAVFARGSTPARTRLYQSGINKHWAEVSKMFMVEGYIDGLWEPLKRKVNYQAFLVYNKQNL